MMHGRLASYMRFMRELPGFLRSPISPSQSRDIIARRIEGRGDMFLGLVKRCVFDNPTSPYLPLMKEAGCEYGDVSQVVRGEGVEALLRRLLAAGVRISLDEFKCREPIRRGRVELRPETADFGNPYLTAGVEVRTGGSTGRSGRSRMDLGFMAERACYESLMVDMLGLRDVPWALWYPILPAATGIGNSLRLAKIGCPSERWFSMLLPGVSAGLESRLATSAIVRFGRLLGSELPRPEPLAMGRQDRIADWVAGCLDRSGSCVVQSYVSQAVRICRAVRKRRAHLGGLSMIVGSEPLTEAKYREITADGARVYPRYAATEMGTIGMGCGNPAEIDEVHVVSDMVALIQDGDARSGRAAPLFLTTLHDTMPQVMINVQLGDVGVVHQRNCGCVFEHVGFRTHLSAIRSNERATGEGMAVSGRLLERIVEEVVVPRCGGSVVDCQWVEREDDRGLTRMALRISPDCGQVDEGSLVRDVLDALAKIGEGERLMAEIWRQTDAVSVVREYPQPTAQGKTFSLQRERHVERA